MTCRRARVLVPLLLVGLVVGGAAARADEPPPSTEREAAELEEEPPARAPELAPLPPRVLLPASTTPPRTEWYGGQLMLSDLGSVLLSPITGGLGLFVGPFLIHRYHGRPERAVQSVALRLLLPAAGAYGGLLIADDDFGSALVAVIIGGTIGELTAMTIDYTVLSAADDVPAPLLGRPPAGGPVAGFRMDRGSFTLTLAGTF